MLQNVMAGNGSCRVDVMFIEMFTGYSKKLVRISVICQIVIPESRNSYGIDFDAMVNVLILHGSCTCMVTLITVLGNDMVCGNW